MGKQRLSQTVSCHARITFGSGRKLMESGLRVRTDTHMAQYNLDVAVAGPARGNLGLMRIIVGKARFGGGGSLGGGSPGGGVGGTPGIGSGGGPGGGLGI